MHPFSEPEKSLTLKTGIWQAHLVCYAGKRPCDTNPLIAPGQTVKTVQFQQPFNDVLCKNRFISATSLMMLCSPVILFYLIAFSDTVVPHLTMLIGSKKTIAMGKHR